jgi:chromosome segregation ATPase
MGRNQEYSALKLRNLEELHQRTIEEKEKMETKLDESTGLVEITRREISSLRDRVESLCRRETELLEHLKSEQYKSKQSQSRYEEEISRIQLELSQLQRDHTQSLSDLSDSNRSLGESKASCEELKRRLRDTAAGLEQDYLAKIRALGEEYESRRHSEREMIRAEAEVDFIAKQGETESQLHADIGALRRQLERAKEDNVVITSELERVRQGLDDERTECNALRLRLRLATAEPHGSGGGGGGEGGRPRLDHRIDAFQVHFYRLDAVIAQDGFTRVLLPHLLCSLMIWGWSLSRPLPCRPHLYASMVTLGLRNW